jgi:hypothetical protein
MSPIKDILNTVNKEQQEPEGWNKAQNFMQSLFNIVAEGNSEKIISALNINKDDGAGRLQTFASLFLKIRNWNGFLKIFGNNEQERAEEFVNLLNSYILTDEVSAIRLVETIFYSHNFSNISMGSMMRDPNFSDGDWQCLLKELSDPNSVLIGDTKKNKIEILRRVPILWSGNSENAECKGNLAKCLEEIKKL